MPSGFSSLEGLAVASSGGCPSGQTQCPQEGGWNGEPRGQTERGLMGGAASVLQRGKWDLTGERQAGPVLSPGPPEWLQQRRPCGKPGLSLFPW